MKNESITMENQTEEKPKWKERIKKMGWAAFLFFFIKGLVWIAIFMGAGKYIKDFFA